MSAQSRRAAFPTTRISLIRAARDRHGPSAHEALSLLCQSYWFPIYAFLRRHGHPHEAAEDLTQGFFAQLLEKRYLDDFEEGRGRFRYMLALLAKEIVQRSYGGPESGELLERLVEILAHAERNLRS